MSCRREKGEGKSRGGLEDYVVVAGLDDFWGFKHVQKRSGLGVYDLLSFWFVLCLCLCRDSGEARGNIKTEK